MKRPISFDQAKNLYVHRFTLEHLPEWAKRPHYDETTNEFIGYYMPQYRTCKEWYDNTIFPGEDWLDRREKFCVSGNQTWPLGKGFSKIPVMKGQI